MKETLSSRQRPRVKKEGHVCRRKTCVHPLTPTGKGARPEHEERGKAKRKDAAGDGGER